MLKKVSFFTTLLLFLTACSSREQPKPLPIPLPQKKKAINYTLHKQNFVTQQLFSAYKKWAGTHYCYGGENTKGIDCSALVQKIYKEAFNMDIPRTTKEQIKIGYKVSKSNLQEGDILFFKTSYKTLHSGIYLERGYFIHTSSKKGVTISTIHNPYWRAKYYQARRVLPSLRI
jgi:lipoprotein Spr/probable lipoprotein NlpC